MEDIPVFLRGDGRLIRVTLSNARQLYFLFQTSNPLNPTEKRLVDLPEHKQRPCGGVLDHLYRRCKEHPELCEEERAHLERSLNRLLATQEFSLSSSEGRIFSGVVPAQRPGQQREVLYTIRCGLLFVLRRIQKEKLLLFEGENILREDVFCTLRLMRFGGAQNQPRQEQLFLRFLNYFDTQQDWSMPLSEFTRMTNRLFLIERVLPSREDVYRDPWWTGKNQARDGCLFFPRY